MAEMARGEVRGEVVVRGVSGSFALPYGRLSVLRGLDLDVAAGKCLAVVGAGGSVKTTLLRTLAGQETPDDGEVTLNGLPVRGVGPNLGADRAVVFQEPRLLPWLTVLDNVAFGLEARGVPQAEAQRRPRAAIRLVGLRDFEAAFPRQLSGGMAQRRASRGRWPSGRGSRSLTSRRARSTR